MNITNTNAVRKTDSAPSFSSPRLSRAWADAEPNELPPLLGQALRDRDARARLRLSMRRRASNLAEVLS